MSTTRMLPAWSGFGKGFSCCIREREKEREREREREKERNCFDLFL